MPLLPSQRAWLATSPEIDSPLSSPCEDKHFRPCSNPFEDDDLLIRLKQEQQARERRRQVGRDYALRPLPPLPEKEVLTSGLAPSSRKQPSDLRDSGVFGVLTPPSINRGPFAAPPRQQHNTTSARHGASDADNEHHRRVRQNARAQAAAREHARELRELESRPSVQDFQQTGAYHPTKSLPPPRTVDEILAACAAARERDSQPRRLQKRPRQGKTSRERSIAKVERVELSGYEPVPRWV
ncbi:hypothetical protein JCM10207_007128 [Rhodosporidiobolus poonsookiae]